MIDRYYEWVFLAELWLARRGWDVDYDVLWWGGVFMPVLLFGFAACGVWGARR